MLIWRTADGDGIGGGLLTIDLDHPRGRIRLGGRHQGFDDVIRDARRRRCTRGPRARSRTS